MNINFEAAIDALTTLAENSTKSDDALKFTQAVLNLAHAESVLVHTKEM